MRRRGRESLPLYPRERARFAKVLKSVYQRKRGRQGSSNANGFEQRKEMCRADFILSAVSVHKEWENGLNRVYLLLK